MIKIFNSLTGSGQYNGEKIPGDLSEWKVLSSDANLLLRSTYGELANRSITLYHTHPMVIGAVEKQVNYAVGPGLVFRSQPDFNTLGIDRVKSKDLGKEFQKIVHYYMQKMNMYEKQAILMRTALTYGDSLLFFVYEDGLSDLVEFSGNQIDWKFSDDNHTLGIKHDDLFRRQGIRKGDKDIPFTDSNGNQNVIQYYDKKLARQLRGYPLAYSIINLAKNDDRHTDATVHRAVMESIIIGSTETEITEIDRQLKNLADTNLKKTTGDTSASLLSKIGNSFKLGAGNMFQMRKGEKINFTDLKTPSSNYAAFKESIGEYIGAATGTPYEVIISKYSTSYTAHRGAFNDFIKSYTRRRRGFEKNVMSIVVKEIAKDAIKNGFISMPGFFDNPMKQAAYLQGMYLGPVPGAINPLQEVNANVKRVDNAFTLRSDIAAQHDHEFDNMIDEWGEEQSKFVSLDPVKQAELMQTEINRTGDE